jgi:hypothetical protein
MAIFDTGSAAYQTTTVTSGGQTAFNANSTALAALSPAVTLKDVTVMNVGSVTAYLGQSGVTATTGITLKPGQQITIQGYTAVTGTTTNNVFAITSSGSTVLLAGLASLASVV